MSGNDHLSPAQVHAKVKHPIIDGDGHWVEFPPVFAEKMRKVGGDKAADGFLAPRGAGEPLKMTPAERTERRIAQPNFWNRQGENTLDRATAMMPKLLYERLDEIGSDFAVIYPTAGLGLPRIKDDETRRAVIRAYNIVSADYFRDFSDRMTPAAVIPMHTPEEAIAGARIRHQAARLEGRDVRQQPAATGPLGRGRGRRVVPFHGVVRRARHRQPL